MRRSEEHPWLDRFAWLTAGATFLLIGLGGVVTSHEAGMSVPDWPTTYGYNMFLFPFHLWTGGIFYEHTHRLLASWVGLLTSILAVWLWIREPRRWLRWLGVAAFFGVVLQGVLGGLRVTLYKDQIGIFHAALAQAFFVTVSLIALFVSGRGEKLLASVRRQTPSPRIRWLAVSATLLIFMQLVLGATMRHQHAGLAVPDFPLAYGHLWPRTDAAFIDQINRHRLGAQEYKPITELQIMLHMAHRIGAIVILAAVAGVAALARRQTGGSLPIARLAATWFLLILIQACLGAATVWSNKAADVATTHVLVGALSLLVGTVLSAALVCSRQKVPSRLRAPLSADLDLVPDTSLPEAKPTAP
jgi:cytochrome c oxidase assembly protein subunit 15